MNKKKIIAAAGISGALCVALGALGAHALKEKLPQENLDIFETAVKYQFYHTLAILLAGVISEKFNSKFLNLSAIFFISGIILFSFSLYFLALRPLMGISNEELKWVGAITPFGGISFILAWLLLAFSAMKPTQS